MDNLHFRDLFGYNPLLCAVKAKARKCVEEIRQAGGIIDIPQFKLGKSFERSTIHKKLDSGLIWKCEKDYGHRT